jgi:hypothetical protein
MAKQRADRRKGRRGLKDLWKLFLAVVGVIAVVQELRKPPDQRTWHGTVGNLVPYDFRKPTFDRFRETYWNPDGPIVSSKLWGVGWAVNVGAVKSLFDR